MIIIKHISSGFKKNLESECSNFYLGGSNNIYIYIYKLLAQGGSFEPLVLYMVPPICILPPIDSIRILNTSTTSSIVLV